MTQPNLVCCIVPLVCCILAGRKLQSAPSSGLVTLNNVGNPKLNLNVATNVAPQIVANNQLAIGGGWLEQCRRPASVVSWCQQPVTDFANSD